MVVTLLATKGGVGKTTTAVNLARGLAEHHPVLLVDCDPQDAGSSTHWLDDPDSRIDVVKVRDIAQIAQLVETWPGILVIDTPRSDDPVTRAVLGLSTLVLCPAGPSEAEVLAAVQSAFLVPAETPCRVLLTRVDGRSLDLYQGAVCALDSIGLPRLDTYVRFRSAHLRAQEGQTTVLDLPGREQGHRDAADDFRRLCAEVATLVGLVDNGPIATTGGR